MHNVFTFHVIVYQFFLISHVSLRKRKSRVKTHIFEDCHITNIKRKQLKIRRESCNWLVVQCKLKSLNKWRDDSSATYVTIGLPVFTLRHQGYYTTVVV